MPYAEPETVTRADTNIYDESDTVVLTAIQKAKAKQARLRLMKERNQLYLAEQRGEEEPAEDLTEELRVLHRD